MSELPNTWIMLPLGKVGRWFGGGTPSKSNPLFWANGSIPWVSPKDMKCDLITDALDHITEDAVAQSATNLVEAGSVLLVVRSGILQHTLPVAVTQRQVALNQDLKAVEPHDNVRSDYLALALKAFEHEILHTCTKTGTTVQSLELPAFLRFEIPVAPLDEQQRIVEEIEKQFTRLDAGIAALRRVQANLKRYRAAVLKAACEGRLVPTEAELTRKDHRAFETGKQLLARILIERRKNWTGRGKYNEPAVPNTADLSQLPGDWSWVSWDTVLMSEDGAFKRGPFGSALTKSIFVEKGFKVYEQYCPINDDCTFVRYYITPEKFEELKGFEVNADDYLISCSGVTLGRITRVPQQFEPGIINQALLRVRINEQVITHRYFLHLFRSPFFQKKLRDNSTGSAIPNVKGVKELKAIPIPLPPLAEQTWIVAEIERRLSVVEELQAVIAANLQRATRLRRSILQKAFSVEI